MTEPPAGPEQPHGAPQQPPYGASQYPQYGAQQPAYGQAAMAPNSSTAVVALVLGIVSWLGCGPFTAIPAIFVGRNAIREIDRSGGQLGGRGLAQAGFWLGVVNTVFAALALVFVVIIFAIAAGTSSAQ